MKIYDLITKTKKVQVIGCPVGLGLYYLNPYQLCNISADGNFPDKKRELEEKYSRFSALLRISRLNRPFLGNDDLIMKDSTLLPEFDKINGEINDPVRRLIWKIFWLNEDHELIDNLPQKIEDVDLEKLSPHSKAVIYHHMAIKNALQVMVSQGDGFNLLYWEQAFNYWNQALNDESFIASLTEIIESEGRKGCLAFRQYNSDRLKDEISRCVLNTFELFPILVIESSHDSLDINTNRDISRFIKTMIHSNLGSEKERMNIVKSIASRRIARDVSLEFRAVDFDSYFEQGDYESLYIQGMKFIDRIVQITQQVYDEAHDQNLHSRTFLSQVIKIDDLHGLVAIPIVKALLRSSFKEGMTKEEMDRMILSQMILHLRLLTETKLPPDLTSKIVADLDKIFERFSLNKLSSHDIATLNENVANYTNHNNINKSVLTKFYCAQYCYFCEGEFADPRYVIIKERERTNGSVVFPVKIIVPRSELACKYHNKELSLDDVIMKRRWAAGIDQIKDELSALAQLEQTLEDNLHIIDNHLNKIEKKKDELRSYADGLKKDIAGKIEDEVKYELGKNENIIELRLNEVEIEKNENKKSQLLDNLKRDRFKEKKRKNKFTTGLVIFIIVFLVFLSINYIELLYRIIGSVPLAGLVIMMAVKIVKSNTRVSILTKDSNDKIASVIKEIESRKNRITGLKNRVRDSVTKKHQPEIEKINAQLESKMVEIDIKDKKENAIQEKLRITMEKEKTTARITGLKKQLANSGKVRPQKDFKSHIAYKKFA